MVLSCKNIFGLSYKDLTKEKLCSKIWLIVIQWQARLLVSRAYGAGIHGIKKSEPLG